MADLEPTLLILRHAHSSWAVPGQRDHLRPLDERGWAQAQGLAALARDGALPRPDRILCSTATRARETIEPLTHAFGDTTPITFSDDLYGRDVEAYYEAVRGADEVGCVLIVGHNPMIEAFALSAMRDDAHAQQAFGAGFPTAALAVVTLTATFRDLAPGAGRLSRIVDPEGRF